MKKLIVFLIVGIILTMVNTSCNTNPRIAAANSIVVKQEITYDDYTDYKLTTIVELPHSKYIRRFDYGTKEQIDRQYSPYKKK